MPVVDRSIRVTSPRTKLSESANRAALEEIALKSGIPKNQLQMAIDTIDTAVFFYRASLLSKDQFPRPSERISELKVLRKRLGSLQEVLKKASQSSWRSIREALPNGYKEVDQLDIQKRLAALAMRVQFAIQKEPSDERGRISDDTWANFLLAIAIAWYRFSDGGKGVTKSQDRYQGPLVNITIQLLKLEHIRYQSVQSVGKKIYSLRKRAEEFAKIDAAKEPLTTPTPLTAIWPKRSR